MSCSRASLPIKRELQKAPSPRARGWQRRGHAPGLPCRVLPCWRLPDARPCTHRASTPKKKKSFCSPLWGWVGALQLGGCTALFFLAPRAPLPVLRPNLTATARTFAQVWALSVQALTCSPAAAEAVSSSIPLESPRYEKNHHHQPQNTIARDRGTGRSGNGAQLPAWSRAHPAADFHREAELLLEDSLSLHACAQNPCVCKIPGKFGLCRVSPCSSWEGKSRTVSLQCLSPQAARAQLLWAFVSGARIW